MSERINKLILETEFKTTGDISPSVQKIDALTKAAKAATGNTLQLVEAEKKLEQAAAQAGVAVETETKKQTEFSKAVQGTSRAMKEITSTNDLKKAFAGGASEIANVNKELEKFKAAARAAKNVDELTQSIESLMAVLPEDVRADAFKLIQKETEKLEKTLERPTSRLRELKRLINTTDDPVLLKKLTAEAAKLQDELGDTNDLIKSLASDTLFTDTLVQGAQTATAAFSAFQGVTTLFAEDNEELAKAAQKAQGAMSALLGIQQLSIELKRKDNIVTKAQELAQIGYAKVVGNSTGAVRTFRVALASIGLALIVGAIIALVANWEKWKDAITGSNEAIRRNNEFTKEAIKNTVEETSKIEIAKARLQDANTTQKERVQIIEDLKAQYPAYLADIDSEKSGYEEIEAALNKVNKALFIKSGIQARESFIAELQLELFETQREIEATQKKAEAFRAGFARDAEERGQNEFFARTAEAEAKSLEQRAQKTKETIESVIADVVKQSQDLTLLGGDPTAQKARAEKTAKETALVLEGTIAFLQKQVSDLSDQLTNDLVIGTDAFDETVKRFILAQDDLEAARKRLGKPEKIEVFTEGSLNDLNQQATELRKIIESLPQGPEFEAAAASLGKVNERIKEINDIISGAQSPEEKRTSLLELLDEDERYQLQSLGIAEETEQKKLALQIKFQKDRIAFLIAAGEEVSDIELMRAQNDLKLLEQQYAKGNEIIKKSNKELVLFLVDGFSQVISAAADTAKTIVSIEQDKYAQLTELQQKRVSDAEKIADRGNAVVLEAEQKRLDELNKKNEEFAQKQIAIAQIQLVAESALAIAKAAAQGGAGAAFTIAAVLIAMAAGFAQARAQSQAVAASFREGGYTGDGDPSRESKNLGDKPYTYHKGEYVIPAPVLSIGHNKDWFTKIHNERIDLDKLLGIKQPSVVVNSPAMERGSDVFLQMNLNSAGIISIKEKHEKLQKKREFLKNWKRVK